MCRGQEMARWSFNATPEPVSSISGVQMTAPVWAATVRTRSPGSLGLSTQKTEATALSSTTTSFDRWRARANWLGVLFNTALASSAMNIRQP